MRFDCHIHTGLEERNYRVAPEENGNNTLEGLKKAGMSGGVIFSVDPIQFSDWDIERRMNDVIDTCKGHDTLYPFFWINPLDPDAVEQVDRAVEKGIYGFKMICSQYFPYDKCCLDVCRRAAELNKPVMFHAGLAWDGINSHDHHRPDNWEAMLEVPNLRFSLAHMGWPWCDECIALYGKLNNALFRRPDTSCEMFFDLTPGTPRMWREEVIRHMFGSEYDIKYNLIFGTDCNTVKYNYPWCNEWQVIDDELWAKYVDGDVEDWKDHVYNKNLMRFLGLSDEKPEKKLPMVAEF